MASNNPQPNRNHFWTVGILVAVIAGLCGVIALLLLRGGKEAPKAEKEPAATPTPLTAPWWDDAYLRNLSDELLILEDNMQAYIEGVPEYQNPPELEDGKLYLGISQVESEDGQLTLEEFEAREDALVESILELIATPDFVETLSEERYLGEDFDPSDPEASLWQKDENGNFIILHGHKLIDRDACRTVISAAWDYLDAYEGEGSP